MAARVGFKENPQHTLHWMVCILRYGISRNKSSITWHKEKFKNGEIINKTNRSNEALFPELTFMVLSLHLLLVTCCSGCLHRWSRVWVQRDNLGGWVLVAFFPPVSVPYLESPLIVRMLFLGKGCSNVTLLFLDNYSKYLCNTIPSLFSMARAMDLLWSHTWLYTMAVVMFDCTY